MLIQGAKFDRLPYLSLEMLRVSPKTILVAYQNRYPSQTKITLLILGFHVHSGIEEGHNVPSNIKTPAKSQVFVQTK